MFPVALWWLLSLSFGLIGLSFTFYLFPHLPDRGYAFGKVLTLLFVSYLLWLLASAHLLPNARPAIIVIVLALTSLSFWLFWRRRYEITVFVSREWRTIVITEGIFTAALFVWAVVRSYTPDLVYGEKLMDFGFLNSTLRSQYFPPHDPWLSGHSISYYYFGYVMMNAVTKLTGVPPAISYNVAIALLFALVATGVFSLVSNLVRLRAPQQTARAFTFGVLGVGIFLLLGNLEGFLEILHSHGFGTADFWKWVGIKGLDAPYQSDNWYPTDYWWWWRGTRLIDTVRNGVSLDYTITEFPFFSFLFGDLHPHIMALPFTLLALGLSLEAFQSRESMNLGWMRRNWAVTLAMLVSLGALGFLNTWDLPTYLGIFLAVLLLKTYFTRRRWREWLAVAAVITVGSIALYLPFYAGLKSQVKGILPWFGPDTRPLHFLLIWALSGFLAVSFLVAKVLRLAFSAGWRRSDAWTAALAALIAFWPLVLWLVARSSLTVLAPGVSVLPSAAGKLWRLLPVLVVLSLALSVLLRRQAGEEWQREKGASLFPLALLFTGLFILMGAELFYLRDTFGTRMNTVFKFYYQAWTLLAITAAFGLYYVLEYWQSQFIGMWHQAVRGLWWTVLFSLAIMAAAYPAAVTVTFTGAAQGNPTLDGLAFVERQIPGERLAIRFLSGQPGNPVIVEAVGNDLNAYGRISARTGLPAVIGSTSHELQWRGYGDVLGSRRADVNTIFTTGDRQAVLALLGKYHISFVYVGPLEKATYGQGVGDRFDSFLRAIYKNDDVTIYQVSAGE
ncbi:MAG: hypothetical protein HY671_14865 [Chloroflexi bacterium]|nr:hypothetical protein [Chloroflexota bacterium]